MNILCFMLMTLRHVYNSVAWGRWIAREVPGAWCLISNYVRMF